MSLENELRAIGLEEKEARIYIASLELGPTNIQNLAKKSGIKRTTVYEVIRNLKSNSLISESTRGKRKIYIAADPSQLIRTIKDKEQRLKEILPQLHSINNTDISSKPRITFFEGKEGLKKVYEDTILYEGETVAFSSYDIVNLLGKEWVDKYIAKRVAKNIQARAIMPGSEKMIEDFVLLDLNQKRQTKIIDAQKYPLSVAVHMYGNKKVALMSAREQMGLIIEGQDIYNTMRLIFELVWSSLSNKETNNKASNNITEEDIYY